jgi:hypothetical protein
MVLTALFGIIATIYSQVQLRETKNKNKTDMAHAKKELERSANSLQVVQQQLETARYGMPKNIELIPNVHDGLEKLNSLIYDMSRSNKKADIKIIGLDLQSVTPWFFTKIIHDDIYDDSLLTFRLLILNPDINLIKPLINGQSNISRDAILNSIKSIKSIEEMRGIDRLNLELRQYGFLPILHGFMVDDEFLGLAFSQIENNKLLGGIYPYIFIRRDDKSLMTKHLFELYASWFNFYWTNSKQVVKINR